MGKHRFLQESQVCASVRRQGFRVKLGSNAGGDPCGDLIEMKLHGFGVAERENKSSAGSAFGADCTMQIGRLGALIMRRGGREPCLAQRQVSYWHYWMGATKSASSDLNRRKRKVDESASRGKALRKFAADIMAGERQSTANCNRMGTSKNYSAVDCKAALE